MCVCVRVCISELWKEASLLTAHEVQCDYQYTHPLPRLTLSHVPPLPPNDALQIPVRPPQLSLYSTCAQICQYWKSYLSQVLNDSLEKTKWPHVQPPGATCDNLRKSLVFHSGLRYLLNFWRTCNQNINSFQKCFFLETLTTVSIICPFVRLVPEIVPKASHWQ